MKKLIAMLGAVAMSFGLFADSYNISFEAADAGVDVSTSTFTPNGTQWTGAAQALGAYADPYDGYEYGTGAFERRDDDFDAKTNDNFLKLETGKAAVACKVAEGNVFLDQTVKFTGFEEAPKLETGDKIAVWASEFPGETDEEPADVRLWVSCGKVLNEETTQIDLPLNVADVQLDKWYRLTIKSLGNVFDGSATVNPRAGFIVYIDGVQVGSSEDAAKVLTDKVDDLTLAAKGLMASGMLFLGYKDNDAAFTTVAYQGIGSVDDIIIDQDGPQFAQMANVAAADLAIDGAVLEKVMQGTEEIPLVGGFYTVSPGDIVAYYTAAAGKILKGDPTATWTAAADGTVTAKDDPDFEVVDAAAQITRGTTVIYKAADELYAAIAQVQDGDVVKFLTSGSIDDPQENTICKFTENTTITVAAVKENEETVGSQWTIYLANYVDEEETTAGKFRYYLDVEPDKQIIVNAESDDASLELNGDIAAAEQSQTFVQMNKGTLVIGDDIVNAGTIKAVDFEFDETTITLTGAGEVIVPTALAVGSIYVDEAEGTLAIDESYVGGVRYFVQTVAPIEYGFKVILSDTTEKGQYETFAEALAAVEEGATIVLLKGVENAPGVVISGKPAFTIDFGGFTWTANKPGAGSSGTEKAAFQILKGQTVVFKNGEMAASEDNLVAAVAPNKNIYRFIQNYGNLTLLDMEFDATNLYIDPNHAADYYPSAIEICYGTVAITGSTSISDKNGMASLTVDTYKTAAYKEGADVTVDTTGSIASILCYSEGTYAQETPSDLVLTAGTIGSLAMAGGEEVTVSKSDDVQLNPPAGYLWNEGVLVAAVAKIGDTYFATLPAAIAAAKSEQTVTLLKSLDLTARTVINKAITLDLNNLALTYTGCSGIQLTAEGATVQNGTVTVNVEDASDWDSAICFTEVGGFVKNMTVNAGNAKYGVVTEYDSGNFNDVTAVCENVAVTGSGVLFYAESENMTLDANCSATQTGLSSAGLDYSDAVAAGWNGKLTIAGGTYVAEKNAVGTMSSPANITISGGTFTGAFNVVPVDPTYASMGDHNVTKHVDVTLAAPAGYAWSTPVENYQTLVKTFALTLTAGANATISSDATDETAIPYGTEVTVTTAPKTGFEFAQASYEGWEFDGANLVSNFVMTAATTITGPDATPESTEVNVKFTAPEGAEVTMVKVNGIEVKAGEDGSYNIAKDATATVTLVADPGLYFANGTNTTTEDVTVTESGAITLETPAPAAAVAMIGDKGYATVSAAVTAAADGAKIEMVANAKVGDERIFTLENKAITLDLAGYKISASSYMAYSMLVTGSGAKLTLMDSSVDGTGVIEKTASAGCFLEAANYGEIVINSGTYQFTKDDTLNFIRVKENGSVVVNGGTLRCTQDISHSTKMFYVLRPTEAGASVTVNGGNIIGIMQNYGAEVSGVESTLTIPADSTALFDRDQTKFCVEGYVTDEHGENEKDLAGWWFVTAGPKYAITYVYGEGTAPATSNKAAFAAYTAARTFTLTQPTAPSGKVFDAWTTDATGVTFDGDAMTIAAEFGTAFTVTATYKADGPVYPPEWPDAPAYAEKFAAWSTAYDLTGVDLTTDAAKNAFLLNVDPKGTLPTLKIDSIEVDNAEETATIVVSAGEKNLGEINGVLYVDVTDELGGEWATRAFDLATEIDKTTGKATFEVSTADGQFMKAKVGFKTPEAE